MLFAAVLTVLLATHAFLVERTYTTLLSSTILLSVLQFARGVGLGNDVYSTCMATLLSFLLVPAVVLVLVAFGAPVLYSQVETVLLAMMMSVLVLQPLLTQYGIDGTAWIQILGLKMLNGCIGGAIGACIGAWIGAVPITLDWDRPWQAYPITIVLGAYAGSAIGTLVGDVFSYQPERVKTSKKQGLSK